MAASGRTSRFWANGGKVGNRRYLAVRPASSEGEESTHNGRSAFAAGSPIRPPCIRNASPRSSDPISGDFSAVGGRFACAVALSLAARAPRVRHNANPRETPARKGWPTRYPVARRIADLVELSLLPAYSQ
jgi:hypothetical protein